MEKKIITAPFLGEEQGGKRNENFCSRNKNIQIRFYFSFLYSERQEKANVKVKWNGKNQVIINAIGWGVRISSLLQTYGWERSESLGRKRIEAL